MTCSYQKIKKYGWGIVGSIICCFLLPEVSYGQDLHFSQFFNSPLTENPANTGFMPDANYRFGGNYRNQWASLGAPYRTFSAYGDAQLLRHYLYYGWVGLGGVLLQDEAGNGGLKSTKLYVSLAYHQLLGNNSLLSLGFNGGYASKRIDMSKLTFPDQFNDQFGKWFFDTNQMTNVDINQSSIGYFDLQIGMNYAYFPTDHIYFNLGASVHHLNRPHESFLKEGKNEIRPRYIGFLSAIMKVGPRVIVKPNGYYTEQDDARETVIGSSVAYDLSGGGEYQLLGGLYYRFDESFIPMVGYQMKDWKIMFSYDVTTSSLSSANQRRGGYEISLTFKGHYHEGPVYNKKSYLCPHF